MLETHLTDTADIIEVTRNVQSRLKEEVETVLHSAVPTLRLHKKPSHTHYQSTITDIEKKQYVFLFAEDVLTDNCYILFESKKYKVDGVEEMTLYSGSTQYRAICNEME